jgi:hypothetical protein
VVPLPFLFNGKLRLLNGCPPILYFYERDHQALRRANYREDLEGEILYTETQNSNEAADL